jgi:hypothetical protein
MVKHDTGNLAALQLPVAYWRVKNAASWPRHPVKIPAALYPKLAAGRTGCSQSDLICDHASRYEHCPWYFYFLDFAFVFSRFEIFVRAYSADKI